MEVTQKNFKQALNLIQQSIEKSDYVAIDAEFTGLRNGWRVSSFDTPAEYYLKDLKAAKDFMLIQFGLCTFYWDHKKNMYKNDAYTFYIYPWNNGKVFSCNSPTLEFLVAHGLDLNKLVKEGIGYMNDKEADAEREKLKKQKLPKPTIAIPDDKRELIEDICAKIGVFLTRNNCKTLDLDKCNSFVELLLYQEVNLRFKKQAFLEAVITDKKDRILRLTRTASAEEWEDLNRRKQERAWEEFDAAQGFSKVAKMIKNSGVLVVGHNMLLDVIHTLDAFYQKLSGDYDQFKSTARNAFHRIIDTKYMSCLPPFTFNSTDLTLLLQELSQPPLSRPEVAADAGRGYTGEEDELHTAGFDAYATGMVFLSLYKILAPGRRVSADAQVLKPYLGKLYLGRTADQGAPCMNLMEKEVLLSRDHVLFVEWKYGKKNKVSDELKKYSATYVEFLSPTTAVVALSSKELATRVQRVFARTRDVQAVSYDEHMNKFMEQHLK